MSFGGPGGGASSSKPIPPQRGSFPLDHEGECKSVVSSYLKCLRSVGGVNDETCRKLARQYLACRMDRNLMAPDSFDNLGLVFEGEKKQAQDSQQDSMNTPAPTSTATTTTNTTTTTTERTQTSQSADTT